MLTRNSMPVKSLTYVQASHPRQRPATRCRIKNPRALHQRPPRTFSVTPQPCPRTLAKIFEISQFVVDRILSTYTPLVAEVLHVRVPTLKDPHPTQQLNLRQALPLALLVLAPVSRAVLGQTPHHRCPHPGGLHPGGKACMGFISLPQTHTL